MNSERTEETSTDAGQGSESAGDEQRSSDDAAKQQPATVLVRGETLRDPGTQSPSKDAKSNGRTSPSKEKESQPKPVSAAKVKMQSRLPALDDEADIGVQKDQVVTRDGKADLSFSGTLLASAAPASAPKGKWDEYRIYQTTGGKHVFSKVTRSVLAEEQDTHVAEVFDPSPSSVPSQLLRNARDLTRAHPLTWTDAAVAFFGYDPLAKALYKKIDGQFEERID